MCNKCTKRCSPSQVIQEMHIKTTITYNFIPIRMAMTNKTDNKICCGECGKRGTLTLRWWEYKTAQPL